MGISLSKIVSQTEINFTELNGKILAVDTMNMLYQFLTTLRMSDGSVLADEKGNVTAHLVGILSRVTGLMEKGIRLVFVFDGKPPELKQKERERRNKIKTDAIEKYEIAKERGNLKEMRKYSQMSTKIDQKIIDDAKKLLNLLGLPIVQATGEGEAQCSYMVKKGDADYVVSQDFDAFLFGAPKVVRNLTLSQNKKKGSFSSQEIKVVELKNVLKSLDINQEQLIILGILIGTDFNRGGIKGIGPMKGLKLVKEFKDKYEDLFTYLEWDTFYDFSWKQVYNIFFEQNYNDNYELIWKNVDSVNLINFLVEERNFSKERVDSILERILKINIVNKQKRLGDFFS